MTLADIENLLDEKDNTIKTLLVELKSVKEENEINYLKYFDINKKYGILEAELSEERLRSGKEEQLKEINNLKKIIFEKTDLIEEERKRILKLREEFGKRLDERNYLEDELLKNSVHVPERLVERSEKEELYQKIQNSRMQINKLKTENEKLKKQLEGVNKSKQDIDEKKRKVNGRK